MHLFAQNNVEGSGAKIGHIGKPSAAISEETIYHEWGHALNESIRSASNIPGDCKTNRFSDSGAFANPYTSELIHTNMNHLKDYKAMHYFDSDNSMEHNRNETFAEMYVIFRGKDSPKTYLPDAMLPKDFAKTYNAEKAKLDELFGTDNDRL